MLGVVGCSMNTYPKFNTEEWEEDDTTTAPPVFQKPVSSLLENRISGIHSATNVQYTYIHTLHIHYSFVQ